MRPHADCGHDRAGARFEGRQRRRYLAEAR